MTATTALPRAQPVGRALGLRIWRLFCSVRLAVVLIAATALVAFAGTFIIQAPPFVQDIPPLYEEWLAVQAAPRWGDLTEPMSALGLFTLYQAPWFRLLLALIAVQVIICTLNRWPAIARGIFEPQVRRNDAFYERASTIMTFPQPAAGITALTNVMRGHGYRVLVEREGDAIYLYGDRHGWAKLATFASHAGLVILLLGGMFSSATAFERELIIPDGATQPLYPVSHPDQIQILNRGFTVTYYEDGRPSDFYSDLALYQGGALVAEKRIRVNDPLDYQGFVFYQASFGKAVSLEILDEHGNVLFAETSSLLDQLGDVAFREIPFPTRGLNLVVALVPDEELRPSNVPQPVGQTGTQLRNHLIILGFRPGTGATGPAFRLDLPPGTSQTVDGLTIRNLGEAAWTGLRVRKDPGVNVMLIGAIIFILFTCITFYFPRRRLWARVRGGVVALGGTADRFIDIRKEIATVANNTAARTG